MDSFSTVTRAEFRRYVRSSIAAFCAIILAIGYALSTKPDTTVLRDGLVSSCERVNILRAQSNTSDFVAFRILSLSGQRENALTKADHKNAKLHRNSAVLLLDLAGQLTITELTDCSLAVDHARTYKFPVANPIGDARTGEVDPRVQRIVDDSRSLLDRHG